MTGGDLKAIIDLVEQWPDFNLAHALRRAAEKGRIEIVRLPDGRVTVVFRNGEVLQ